MTDAELIRGIRRKRAIDAALGGRRPSHPTIGEMGPDRREAARKRSHERHWLTRDILRGVRERGGEFAHGGLDYLVGADGLGVVVFDPATGVRAYPHASITHAEAARLRALNARRFGPQQRRAEAS